MRPSLSIALLSGVSLANARCGRSLGRVTHTHPQHRTKLDTARHVRVCHPKDVSPAGLLLRARRNFLVRRRAALLERPESFGDHP